MCRAPIPTVSTSAASFARALVLVTSALVACRDAPPPPPLLTPPPVTQEAPGLVPPRLGLWVPCEGSQRVLEDPERITTLLTTARSLGATDLFVQVYRGGRAWYDATLADATPFRALSARGADPLEDLLDRAHAQGLRVHAWVNVLSLGTHRDGPLLRSLGDGVIQVDRNGRSLLDYPDLQVPDSERRWVRIGTPAIWLDPATPGLAERLAAVFGELLMRHPRLDGLHLDYIRYPDVLPFTPGARFDVGLDFGFGDATRARFRKETGLEAPFREDSRNAEAFDDWRRARLAGLVGAIAKTARTARPGIEMSAAVWSFPSRAYLSLHQDWTRWLEEDSLDFAIPMVYSRDPRLFTMLLKSNVALGSDRTWIGLGSWLFANAPDAARSQLREARAANVPGVALFSYDAIVESPALQEALAPEALP